MGNSKPSKFCECGCGLTTTLIRVNDAHSGLIKGQYRRFRSGHNKPNLIHGHAYLGKKTRTYGSWAGMICRCNNPNEPSFPRYGGRGITVAERWLSFENFLEDMGERPPSMTLDRKDNDGNYEPGNCRWASKKTQQNNMRSNIRITAFGRTQNVAAWAKEFGFNFSTLRGRFKTMTAEDALTRPLKGSKPDAPNS